MTFPFIIKKRPPKEVKLHFIKFRLKGYAIKNSVNAIIEGYFRSLRDSISIFDSELNRKRELLINYRDHGDDYSTFWGFKYIPEERIIHCGLDDVILTVDHSSQSRYVDIITPSSPRKSYETKFLSTVAESIAQKVSEVESTLPIPPKSCTNNFNINTFPDYFQDTFKVAIKEGRAFSFKEVYVSICFEHLGIKAGKSASDLGYSATEVCGGCYHQRPNKA